MSASLASSTTWLLPWVKARRLPSSSFGLANFTPGLRTKPWVSAMSASIVMLLIGSFWPPNTTWVKLPPTPMGAEPPPMMVSVSAADCVQRMAGSMPSALNRPSWSATASCAPSCGSRTPMISKLFVSGVAARPGAGRARVPIAPRDAPSVARRVVCMVTLLRPLP
nr:hypothetical protein [Siccirubricoccus phaeus]